MIKLLFLCTHNACRSILAEAIAQKLGGNRWAVASAGIHPAGRVHPLTLKYLYEAGYRTSRLESKGWDDLTEFQPDLVITVCDQAAGESCPVWFGQAAKGHWGLSDPSRHRGNDEDVSAAFKGTIALLAQYLDQLLQHPIETMTSDELKTLLRTIRESD